MKDGITPQLTILMYNVLLGHFKYEQLEELGLEHDIIERCLMVAGICCMFKENNTYYALPCTISKYTVTARPKKVIPYVFMADGELKEWGKEKTVGVDCAVIINNAEMQPSYYMITPYLKRLSLIWKEAGNNLKMSKIFGILSANAQTMKEMQKAWNKMLEEGGSVVSTENASAMVKALEKFDFKVEYRQAEYHQDFESTWQMLLTMCGINNVGSEKKERLLTGEIEANNEILEIIEQSWLSYRKSGLNQFNKLYGTNVTVEAYCKLDQTPTEQKEKEEKEKENE
jgi:hypothetical protein